MLLRVVTGFAAGHDLVRGQAEDENILLADLLHDLHVGAVQRADGQGAVQRQLHVAGAGSLHSGR